MQKTISKSEKKKKDDNIHGHPARFCIPTPVGIIASHFPLAAGFTSFSFFFVL
jgi:hypothetical protein